jgi:hypothetical protein
MHIPVKQVEELLIEVGGLLSLHGNVSSLAIAGRRFEFAFRS